MVREEHALISSTMMAPASVPQATSSSHSKEEQVIGRWTCGREQFDVPAQDAAVRRDISYCQIAVQNVP